MSRRETRSAKEREVNVFYETAFSLTDAVLTHPKLQKLVIVGQPGVTSAEAISGLKRLRELWIVECCLKDVSALKKCLRLEKLCLYTNDIREMPDLSSCEKLKFLSLARNKIRDIQRLQGIPHLRDLNLADNEIESVPNIFTASSELEHINLSKNPLHQQQDVENLCKLTKLLSIEFADPVYGESSLVSLYNYRPHLVRRLPSLREIDYYPICSEEKEQLLRNELSFYYQTWPKHLTNGSLNEFGLSKMFSLDEFSRLTHLTISRCSISEVNLSNVSLPCLESLDLSHNAISSLRGLKSFQKLRTLCLSHNRLGSRDDFENSSSIETDSPEFSKLSALHADHNELNSIADLGLPRASNLKYLFLQRNKIRDIDGIEKFPNLISAVLDHNRVNHIAEAQLGGNGDIRMLLIENNKLASLRFATRLLKIEKLFVANNRIEDKMELRYLGASTNLQELTILGNPLCNFCNHYVEIRETLGSIKTIDGHSAITGNPSIFEEVQ